MPEEETMVRTTKDLSISDFYGEPGDNAASWIDSMDRCGNHNRWSPEYRLDVAFGRLKGEAGAWGLAKRNKIDNWSTFKTSFKQRFALSKRQLRQTLAHCKQRYDESVLAYTDRYEGLCAQLDVDETDDDMMYSYLDGLLSEELHKATVAKYPTTLQEAMHHACQLSEYLQKVFRGNNNYTGGGKGRDYGAGYGGRTNREDRGSMDPPRHQYPRDRDNRDNNRDNGRDTRNENRGSRQPYDNRQDRPKPFSNPPPSAPAPKNAPTGVDDLTREMARLALAFKQHGIDIGPVNMNAYHADGMDYDDNQAYHQPRRRGHGRIHLYDCADSDSSSDYDDEEAYYHHEDDEGVYIKRTADFDVTRPLPSKRVTIGPEDRPRTQIHPVRTRTVMPGMPVTETPPAPVQRTPAPTDETRAPATGQRIPYRATRNPSDPTRRATMLPTLNPEDEEQKLTQEAVQKVEKMSLSLSEALRLNPAKVYAQVGKVLIDKSRQARRVTDPGNGPHAVQAAAAPARMELDAHYSAMNNIRALSDRNTQVPIYSVSRGNHPVPVKPPRYSICRATCSVDGYEAEAIVDSGASNTVVSRSFLRKVGLSDYIQPSKMEFWNADGVKSTAAGIVKGLDIGVGDFYMPMDAFVSDARTYEVILGGDYLGPANACINYKTRKLGIQSDHGHYTWVDIRVGGPVSSVNVFDSDSETPAPPTHFLDLITPQPLHGLDDRVPHATSDDLDTEHGSAQDGVPELEPGSDEEDDMQDMPALSDDSDCDSDDDASVYSINCHTMPSTVQPSPTRRSTSSVSPFLFNRAVNTPLPVAAPVNRTPPPVILTPPMRHAQQLEHTIASKWTEVTQHTNKKDTYGYDIKPDPDEINFNISDHLNQSDKTRFEAFLRANMDVFAANRKDLGCTNVLKMTIITGDAAPIYQKPHRMSRDQLRACREEIDAMLAEGIIEPSNSPWASPVVMVPKPVGWRFCTDYRALNKITKYSRWPIPRVDDAIDSVGKAAFFTTLDLMAGFWQVELDEASKEKSCMITPFGTYQWRRMVMGLAGSPSTWCQLMSIVLRGLISGPGAGPVDDDQCCMVYMDDIIVWSDTLDQHMANLAKVFDRLRQANLRIKVQKCEFAKPALEYLGHWIDGPDGTISLTPMRIAAIQQYPMLTTPTQVRAFLGLTGYYRKFVKDYAKIALPLYELTCRDVPWRWTTRQQHAFDTLKAALISEPILRRPDFNKPFILQTDWCKEAVAACLSQLDEATGYDYAVYYASKKLSGPQINWSASEGECYAVVWATKLFRPYLLGTHFIIQTDHAALKWLMTTKDFTGKLARWSLKLQEYDFEIQWRKGKSAGNVDGLSRLAQFTPASITAEADLIQQLPPDDSTPHTLPPGSMSFIDHVAASPEDDPIIRMARQLRRQMLTADTDFTDPHDSDDHHIYITMDDAVVPTAAMDRPFTVNATNITVYNTAEPQVVPQVVPADNSTATPACSTSAAGRANPSPARAPALYKAHVFDATINGHPTRAVIDSHSTVTHISAACLQYLKKQPTIAADRNPPTLWIAGTAYTATGVINNLSINIGGLAWRHGAYVVDCPTYDIVIGADFLCKALATVDMHNRSLTVNHAGGARACVSLALEYMEFSSTSTDGDLPHICMVDACMADANEPALSTGTDTAPVLQSIPANPAAASEPPTIQYRPTSASTAITVNEHPVKGYLDTSSGFTHMSSALVATLLNNQPASGSPLTVYNTRPRSLWISGTRYQTLGCAEVRIGIAGFTWTISAHVVPCPLPFYTINLGVDFISQAVSLMNYRDHTLTVIGTCGTHATVPFESRVPLVPLVPPSPPLNQPDAACIYMTDGCSEAARMTWTSASPNEGGEATATRTATRMRRQSAPSGPSTTDLPTALQATAPARPTLPLTQAPPATRTLPKPTADAVQPTQAPPAQLTQVPPATRTLPKPTTGATGAGPSRTTPDDDTFDLDSDMEQTNCNICHRPHAWNKMLICDGCNGGFHTFCLSPPVRHIPVDDWFCPACTSQPDAEYADAPPPSDSLHLKDPYNDQALLTYLRIGEIIYPHELSSYERTLLRKRVMKRAGNYYCDDGDEIYKAATGPTDVQRRVPRPEERASIIYDHHDELGHQGINKTYTTLQLRFFWPGMLEEIQRHIRACDKCKVQKLQLMKQNVLRPLPVVGIWHRVHIDCMGPYPTTAAGNKYIVLAVDSFSKWPEAKAVPNIKCRTIATFIEMELLARHGCMRELCSDRGTEFTGPEVQHLLRNNNIQHVFTAGYKPNSNGQAERIVGVMRGMLARYLEDRDSTWDLGIAHSLRAYRTSPSSTTRISPAYAMYGREFVTPPQLPAPRTAFDLQSDDDACDADDDTPNMQAMLNERAARLNSMALTLVANTDRAKDKDMRDYAKRKLTSAPTGGKRPHQDNYDPSQPGPSHGPPTVNLTDATIYNTDRMESPPPNLISPSGLPASTPPVQHQPQGVIYDHDSMHDSSETEPPLDSTDNPKPHNPTRATATSTAPKPVQDDPLAHLPDLEDGAHVWIKRQKSRFGRCTDGPYFFRAYNPSGSFALLEDGSGKQFPVGIERLAYAPEFSDKREKDTKSPGRGRGRGRGRRSDPSDACKPHHSSFNEPDDPEDSPFNPAPSGLPVNRHHPLVTNRPQ